MMCLDQLTFPTRYRSWDAGNTQCSYPQNQGHRLLKQFWNPQKEKPPTLASKTKFHKSKIEMKRMTSLNASILPHQ